MSTDEYRASQLSAVADQFAELRLPVKPRLVTDLFPVLLPSGGLHLIGADPKTLHGESLGWMLRSLFPLLDGTRTISGLKEALSRVAIPDLRDVLSLLHMHGMLEEGADGVPERERQELREAHGSQMEFFSRYLRLTGRHSHRFGVQRALGRGRVLTVGVPEHRAVMTSLLLAAGLGECLEVDLESVADGDFGNVDLFVIIGNAEAQERLAAKLRATVCLFVDPDVWTLGPLTVFGHSPCPTCVRLQQESISDGLVAGDIDPYERALWCRALLGRAAQHVIAYITGLYQSQAFEHLERWDPVTGATSLRAFIRQLPNCPTCGDNLPPLTLTLASGHRDNRVLRFHRSAMLKLWHLEQPAAIQMHLSQGVSRQLRNARLLPRRVLAVSPKSEQMSPLSLPPPSAPQAERLAQLLTLSFGGRVQPEAEGGHRFDRNTASAGNLGSAEPYVVVMAVDGFTPGIYHYDTVRDTLGAVRYERPETLRHLLPQQDKTRAGICAAIVIVSAVGRLCAKYEARGYVYSLFDAGIMTHRVGILARSLGLDAAPRVDFDDEMLCQCLGVDGLDLVPTILVGLRGASGGVDETPPPTSNLLAW